MQPMRHVLLFSSVMALTAVSGCKQKLELDSTVDGIVGALSECNQSELDKHIAPELSQELQQKFDGMCHTVQWFGKLENRKQTGISVSPGKSQGNYELTFENGALDMELMLTEGKITMFEFKGEDWFKAKAALEAEKYSEYKVYGFEWLDAEGNVNAAGNKYAPGPIHYRIKVGGIEAKDGKFALGLTTRIVNAAGQKMWESPQPEKIQFDQDDKQIARSGDISGSVTIPEKGSFQIEFDLEDQNAGKKTSYAQGVVVE
jgi:hypothetical protein